MGYDLSGAGGYFRWTGVGWAEVLDLGQEFGWEPAGTGPPRGELKADWFPGPYHSNEGQRFYAADARGLADALERALAAVPQKEPPSAVRGRRGTSRPRARHISGNSSSSAARGVSGCTDGRPARGPHTGDRRRGHFQ